MSEKESQDDLRKRAIELCNPAFARWQKKIGSEDLDVEHKYQMLLLPHVSRKNEDEYMGIVSFASYQKRGKWDFETYATTGHHGSPPIVLGTGDDPTDLLPDPEDGAILKRYGIRIRLEHRNIPAYVLRPAPLGRSGLDLPTLKPGTIYLDDACVCGTGSKWYDNWIYDNVSGEDLITDTIGGLVNRNTSKMVDEVKKLRSTIDQCTQTLDAFREYAKDVYGIEKKKNKKKRKRED